LKIYEKEIIQIDKYLADPKFADMLKKAFVRVAFLMVQAAQKREDSIAFPKWKRELSEREIKKIRKYVDTRWANHIKLEDIHLSTIGRSNEKPPR